MTTRAALAILVVLLVGSVSAARPNAPTLGGTAAFGGAGGGGGTPTPPIGKAPYDPALILASGGGPILLSVLAPAERVVVLRRLDGSLWHVATSDAAGRLLLAVPPGGALIDIPGTDVVGLPVAPWQRVTVYDDR